MDEEREAGTWMSAEQFLNLQDEALRDAASFKVWNRQALEAGLRGAARSHKRGRPKDEELVDLATLESAIASFHSQHGRDPNTRERRELVRKITERHADAVAALTGVEVEPESDVPRWAEALVGGS